MVRQGVVWQGEVRYGKLRCGQARRDLVRFGEAGMQ